MSTEDLEEYWENIKRNAITEIAIMNEQQKSAKENKHEDKDYSLYVVKQLKKQKQKDEGTFGVQRKDSTKNLEMLRQPKNDFEVLLHRKLVELNETRMELN